MLTFLIGFIASLAHVVTGPDHLAAVTPLAIETRKKSWIIGFSWGLGHTLGVLLIGLLFILFRKALPVEAISQYSDKVVGILLILIGLRALMKNYRKHKHHAKPHAHFHTSPYLYTHIHKHSHDLQSGIDQVRYDPLSHKHTHTLGFSHSFEHSHTPGPDNKFQELCMPEFDHGHQHKLANVGNLKQNTIAAFSIGIMHGFAGFSHLFALLPSLALPTIWTSVIYIGSFASGTIFTMVLFAFILGLVAYKTGIKNKQIFLKWFSFAGAAMAIFIGVFWIIKSF